MDIGFAQKSKSCGIAFGDSEPREIYYGDLEKEIIDWIRKVSCPVNLLIEAPLSVAFSKHGNPTGRKIEKRGDRTRYWHVGPGAATLLAAMYLLRRLYDLQEARTIRLFEGFASFKMKGKSASHPVDVEMLRNVAWGESGGGRIVFGDGLKMEKDDILCSAFAVSGMDFGIPAVVIVEDRVTW